MKKCIPALLLALLPLNGCQDSELTDATDNARRVPMSFDTYNMSTVRSVITGDNLKQYPFRLFAQVENTEAGATTGQSSVFLSDMFHYDGRWKGYNLNEYLWPQDAELPVQFYGLLNPLDTESIYENGWDNFGNIIWSFPYLEKETRLELNSSFPCEDIMVADEKLSLKQSGSGTGSGSVTLSFEHILAQVMFEVAASNSDYVYELKRLTLKYASEGVYNFEPAEGEEKLKISGSASYDDRVELTYYAPQVCGDATYTPIILPTDGSTLVPTLRFHYVSNYETNTDDPVNEGYGEDYVIVFPSECEAYIEYYAYPSGIDRPLYEEYELEQYKHDGTIKFTPVAGKTNRIKINIGLNTIKLDPQADPWTEAN